MRSTSVAATISSSAAVRAGTSSGPSRTRGEREVVGGAFGRERLEDEEPFLGERERRFGLGAAHERRFLSRLFTGRDPCLDHRGKLRDARLLENFSYVDFYRKDFPHSRDDLERFERMAAEGKKRRMDPDVVAVQHLTVDPGEDVLGRRAG